jgi:hypothetical protein
MARRSNFSALELNPEETPMACGCLNLFLVRVSLRGKFSCARKSAWRGKGFSPILRKTKDSFNANFEAEQS